LQLFSGINVVARDRNSDPAPPPATSGLILNLDAGNSASWTGQGTIRYDTSGSGNNATLNSGVAYSSNGGGSFLFDNVDDFVSLPNSLGYTTNVSLFAWIRTTGTPKGGYHIVFGGQELEISIPTDGQIRTGVFTNSRFVSNHGGGLTDGNWHYVGFTFDGSTKRSYIDGVEVGTQGTSGTLTSTFTNRTMGRYGNSTQYYMNGRIATAQIYNRVITPTEVLGNYTASRARFQ
jgi:hypothetical protein